MILSSRTRAISRASWPRSILRSPLYPVALQVAAGLLFILIYAYAFFGPAMGENNLAVVATWQLWWLLLPFSFLFLGRLWCTVCPIGAVNGLSEKVPFRWRKMPGALLRRSDAWIMGSLFLVLFWIGIVRHICCWPKATAIVLLLFTGGAVVAGLLFHGRAWCRYFCPVGLYSAMLSLASFLGLRSQKQICRETCRVNKRHVLQDEMKGCPLYELPMALDTNRNCNLCGQCVKYCPHGSLQLSVLDPSREMSRMKRPRLGEAIFIMTLMGIAFVEVLQTTQLLPRYMKWALEMNVLGSYDIVFSLTIFAVVALALGLYLIATGLAGRLGRWNAWPIASFSYGFIPIALATTLGVALFRLASEGARATKVAVNQLSFVEIFNLPPPIRGSFYEVNTGLKALQLAVLALGVLATLYVIVKIANRRGGPRAMMGALPVMALALVFAGALSFIFLQPAGLILH